MTWTSTLSNSLSPLSTTIIFIKRYLLTIIALGLLAAFGRVIQLGSFGEIPAWAHITLEVVIEGSRILIILFALGMTTVKRGARYIKNLFTDRTYIRTYTKVGWNKFKHSWFIVLVNFIGFILIAMSFNLLIEQLAYETCLLVRLKEGGVVVDKSSEWTILLFFKNITVIPFTLVFETILALWMVNKITSIQDVSSV